MEFILAIGIICLTILIGTGIICYTISIKSHEKQEDIDSLINFIRELRNEIRNKLN